MRGYSQFSVWISITLVKIYIFSIIINQGKNTFELVGTVLNRPFSNSHGWIGSNMEWRLMRADLFKCKLICPHKPPLHARSSPTVRIRNWPIKT